MLADSLGPVAECMNAALVDLGYGARSDDEIRAVIGPPVEIGIGGLLDLPPESDAVAEAVAAYRSRYVNGLRATRAYDGIAEVIAELGATRRLAIATSKPLIYAQPVLEAIGLGGAFDVVIGPVERADQSKRLQVKTALEALGEPASAMVGDRRYDMEAAREFGLLAVGAVWGFGGREELEAAGADVLVDAPRGLLEVL